MAVVSDTSPLSYLVLIGADEALSVLYGRGFIPPAVVGELSHPDGPEPTRQWIEEPPEWLRVEEVPEENAREGGPSPESKLWSLETGMLTFPRKRGTFPKRSGDPRTLGRTERSGVVCDRPKNQNSILDPGERQAIRLAEKAGAKALLIDERDGRQVAKQRGVPVTGTIGVLDEAATEGLVDARQAADRLWETSFRAPEELYQWLLDRHE